MYTGTGEARLSRARCAASGETGLAHRFNGELLRLAEDAGFDLFIICDKNMRYQQQVLNRGLAILELWTNHRPTLEQHLAYIRAAGESALPGTYTILPPPP